MSKGAGSKARFLLGVDPGFASCGYAVVALDPDGVRVVRMGVIRTQQSSRKARVMQADDNFRRIYEIAKTFGKLLEEFPIVALCAEAFSYPRNASAAAKVAMVWGVMASVCSALDLPMFQISPQRLKGKLGGRGNCSKQEIAEIVGKRFVGTNFEELLQDVPGAQREHAWDAFACVVACLDAEPIKLIRKMIKRQDMEILGEEL